MNPLTPPHSSPEGSPPPPTASRPPHPHLYRTASSPEDRPEPKRPRSSLSSHHDETSQLATPALTPEHLLPSGSESTFPSTLEAEKAQAVEKEKQQVTELKLQAEKDRFVNGLVGASVLAIESIWGPSSTPSSTSSTTTQFSTASTVLPLHYFVREVLRRSRTSCSTLQLALYYLHKSRKPIRDAVARAQESREEVQALAKRGEIKRENKVMRQVEAKWMDAAYFEQDNEAVYPSPPESPESTNEKEEEEEEEEEEADSESLTDRLTRLLQVQKSPLLCGRRMFLASLISASKYLQDRNFSNRAWAKISGLDIKEINANERAFLELVEWELHLKAEDFKRWTERLNTLTTSTSTCSSSSGRQGLTRSASEYVAAPSPISAVRPTSSNLVRSKLALTRGHSAPRLESSSSTRSSGFPIAQPISRLPAVVVNPPTPAQSTVERKEEQEEEETEIEIETTEEEDNGVAKASLAPVPRKVRALPVRSRIAPPSSRVPTHWAAGSSVGGNYVVGRTGELVLVH